MSLFHSRKDKEEINQLCLDLGRTLNQLAEMREKVKELEAKLAALTPKPTCDMACPVGPNSGFICGVPAIGYVDGHPRCKAHTPTVTPL